MRKLLQYPNRPALLYLHWWSPTLNQGQRSFWRAPPPSCNATAAGHGIMQGITRHGERRLTCMAWEAKSGMNRLCWAYVEQARAWT